MHIALMAKKFPPHKTLPQWMDEASLKDEDVAAMVDRDRSSISRFRRGVTLPDYDLMLVFETISGGVVALSTWATLRQQREVV
jgi:hypothetical protein